MTLLSELALLSTIRDEIAAAGGIEPAACMLRSSALGSCEVAARALAHLAYEDESAEQSGTRDEPAKALKEDEDADSSSSRSAAPAAAFDSMQAEKHAKLQGTHGCAERRAMIVAASGVSALIVMLHGTSGMTHVEPVKGILGRSFKEEPHIRCARMMMPEPRPGTFTLAFIPLLPFRDARRRTVAVGRVGVREQAAITLAEMAKGNHALQDAIIDAGAVAPLLKLIRLGSQLGQEHAARAIWHLSDLRERQMDLVSCGAIPDLVQLIKVGSMMAQEMAAAGLFELAHGCVLERQARAAAAAAPATSHANAVIQIAKQGEHREGEVTNGAAAVKVLDRLVQIMEAGGITALVNLTSAGTAQARENAAGTLWHLAYEITNQPVRHHMPHTIAP